ncbi:hypothetical protein DFR49_0324 [Hephaestia caeni]|uniref:Uncharacterized protein n=1 Tax=Hephaestia caeni TaxID=645617 RepID=A0A397PF44_9SPHN|nr:hypothetical protein DFR49_0324 [Hephaestia caeni]
MSWGDRRLSRYDSVYRNGTAIRLVLPETAALADPVECFGE